MLVCFVSFFVFVRVTPVTAAVQLELISNANRGGYAKYGVYAEERSDGCCLFIYLLLIVVFCSLWVMNRGGRP